MEAEIGMRILARLIVEEHCLFIDSERLALNRAIANRLEPWFEPEDPEVLAEFGQMYVITEEGSDYL